jgi:hypothetical protein
LLASIITADGIGENLGWVCDEKNAEMMTKSLWNDAHKGIRNEIDFINKTAN